MLSKLVTEQLARVLFRMKTLLSFFTGGGLADIGAKLAGYETLWGLELNKRVAERAAERLGHMVLAKSILDVSAEEVPTADVWWLSPPCQDFSLARAWCKEEANPNSELANKIVDLISQRKPGVVVIENVKAYQKSDQFSVIRDSLVSLGYTLTEQLMDAANYGVPSNRLRFFCVATLKGANYAQPIKLAKEVNWNAALGTPSRLAAPLLTNRAATTRQHFDNMCNKHDDFLLDLAYVGLGAGHRASNRPAPTVTCTGAGTTYVRLEKCGTT